MSKADLTYIFRIVMTTLIFLKISTSSTTEFTDREILNSEVYKAFLTNVLKSATAQTRTDDVNNKIAKNQKFNESPYEGVMRNLRSNWEMPMNYLQERGYLKDLDSKKDNTNNDLSMDAYNLINGPILNPSTYVYPIPQGPNSFLMSTKTDRSDRASNKKLENVGANSGAKTRSYDENVKDCSDPSMSNDLACFDQYFGENWAKSFKSKWDSLFKNNQSTTTTTTTTTPVTTTTTETPTTTTPLPDSNKTFEVISDLSLQDARDGLEFFKIYNDFMLAKLASKLSQNAHERRMLQSSQNQENNNLPPIPPPPMIQNPTQAPQVPDFSKIDENDIKVLKELDSCLKNKKTSTNVDGNGRTDVDVTNERRVSDNYLPTKLKFLAHLHHEVPNFGQMKSINRPSPNQNANGCNVDITNLGTTTN